jgi:predicted amidophosphoribosyltransferase
MNLMNHKNTVDKRPYLCPGCETPLDTDRTDAVAHMANCDPLQQMIAIARYAHELRNKAVEAMQAQSK